MTRQRQQDDPWADPAGPATLDYATPPPKPNRYPEFAYLSAMFRRLVFAAGAMLLAGGLGLAINPRSEGGYAMAWGDAVLSFFVPLRRAQAREK